MEKKEQIEEIGRYMAKVSHSECALKMCEDCKWCGEGDGKADCMDYLIAEHLYNAGYRKQADGEWLWTENGEADYEKYWVCSVCKEHDFVKTKFCSNCGAKMKGAEDGKAKAD